MKKISVLLAFVSAGLILYSGLNAVGCNWGGSGSFTCETFTPLLLLCSLISLVLSICLFINNKTESITGRRNEYFVPLILIITIFPFLIALIYNNLDNEGRLKYYEGYTPESCISGHASVPWSPNRAYFDTDLCWLALDKCEMIESDYVQSDCYFTEGGALNNYENKIRKDKISTVDQCGQIRNEVGRVECINQLTVRDGIVADCYLLQYNSHFEETNKLYTKRQCIMDALDYNKNCRLEDYRKGLCELNTNDFPVTVSSKDFKGCQQFSSTKKDICLYYQAEYARELDQTSEYFCGQIISLDIQTDCRRYAELNK